MTAIDERLTALLEVLPDEDGMHVRSAAARLEDEFAGVFGKETILLFVAESLGSLAGARVTGFVPLLTERFVRQRLRALAKVEGKSLDRRPTVLFLCVQNAGRSQMAAGWLRHLAGEAVEVYSAGSEPGTRVNPVAVEAMAEVGIDIEDAFPKPWTDEMVRAADVVVTMGCGDACPIFPGIRYEDWPVPDPAGRGIEEVRPIRDELRARVGDLIERLEVGPPAVADL